VVVAERPSLIVEGDEEQGAALQGLQQLLPVAAAGGGLTRTLTLEAEREEAAEML
jgi:hypothetical protein